MNKKIKLIELLNRIANKKDLPNSIYFYGEQYDLDRHDTYINYGYTDENNCDRWLIDDKWEIAQCLNDEVEILEDNTEEIEELSTYRTFAEYDELAKKCINMNAEQFFYKINELVKAVNSIRRDKNND